MINCQWKVSLCQQLVARQYVLWYYASIVHWNGRVKSLGLCLVVHKGFVVG